MASYQAAISQAVLTTVLVVVTCSSIAIILILLFSRSVSKQLRNLAQVAHAIQKGDLSMTIAQELQSSLEQFKI